jgi:hypothetical protein
MNLSSKGLLKGEQVKNISQEWVSDGAMNL